MNNRRRLLQRLTLPDIRPHYNYLERCWKARVHGRTVTGGLMHVASEYAGAPPVGDSEFYESYYPYALQGAPVRVDWEDHGHTMTDVLMALLSAPRRFTIADHEDAYTPAERQLIASLQHRLIAALDNRDGKRA